MLCITLVAVAKKNKKNESLPEGMSRRQAKLAARAAERAALERDPRPYADFAMEADLIALQEFVPSAFVEIAVKGSDRRVLLATVLPGAVAAVTREAADGAVEALVALQSQRRGDNPNRDLAYALQWAVQAPAASTLEVGIADGSEPALKDLLDPATQAEIVVAQDFAWWVAPEQLENPQVAAMLQRANESILPSDRVAADVTGAAWWINPGEKAHIRWVRPEAEEQLLPALARVHAAGDLHLGEGSKFAGVFRTHGVLVPVWDLDASRSHDAWADGLVALEAKLAAALQVDAALSADEQKSRQTIISREVTIR